MYMQNQRVRANERGRESNAANWEKTTFFPVCHCELRLFLICDNLWHTKPYFIFQFYSFSLSIHLKPKKNERNEQENGSIEALHWYEMVQCEKCIVFFCCELAHFCISVLWYCFIFVSWNWQPFFLLLLNVYLSRTI